MLRPRIVIEFGESFSPLLEDRTATLLAAEFIAVSRQQLTAKGGQSCLISPALCYLQDVIRTSGLTEEIGAASQNLGIPS